MTNNQARFFSLLVSLLALLFTFVTFKGQVPRWLDFIFT